MPDFDLVVIGAGAAGRAIAVPAAALGLKVALVERARIGVDPAMAVQAMRAAGMAATAARGAGRFGIRLPEPEIDWAAMRRHVQAAVAALAPEASAARLRGLGIDFIQANGHFAGPRMVEAGGQRLGFRQCVIAAGSAPVVPNIPGLGPVPWLTTETVHDLEEPPGHLLVLGGGAAALELAQAHARLGCLVTVLAAGGIASTEDPELVEGLRRVLLRDGIELIEGVELARVEPDPTPEGEPGLVALLADGRRIAGTHLLLAGDRAPRLAGLDLTAGQVEATARGIATDAGLRSRSNPRVYATGSVADLMGLGQRDVPAVAGVHGMVLAKRLFFRIPAKVDYASLPRWIAGDPELAQVGLTEAEARAAGHEVRLLRAPVAGTHRALADKVEDGLVKLVADASGRLLGAGILAPGAGEMAAAFGLMLARGTRLGDMSELPLPHPTLMQAARQAAQDFYIPKMLTGPGKTVVGLLKRLP